jgi:ABC-type transport system involved in cytochrome c biogenesis permease subunit
MEFLPTLAMAALTLKIIDFLRYVRAADINGVLTQLFAWVGGVVVVILAANTDWASGIQIGDKNLANLGFWSLVFFGLTAGSGASIAKDTLKAVDNSNSAAIPVLVPTRGTTRKVTEPTEVG